MSFFLPSRSSFHTHPPTARESIVSKCPKGIQESNLWKIVELINLNNQNTEYIVLNITADFILYSVLFGFSVYVITS